MISEGSIPLGKWSTSFQAETRALESLCRDIISRIIRRQLNPNRINIMVSSKAAIQLQRSRKLTTPSLIVVRRLLEVLQNHAPTSLYWMKPNPVLYGISRTKALAKQAALTPMRNPETPHDDIPLIMFQNMCRDAVIKDWTSIWQSYPPNFCRQSRIFMKQPDRAQTKEILKLGRLQLGQLARFLTGHNRTRRHQAIVDHNQDPTAANCRHCPGNAVEDAEHIIKHCPHWSERRRDILEFDPITDPEQLPDWMAISEFLYCDEILDMEKQDDEQD